MNGIFNPIVFYPSAIIMIVFAILAIKFKNIFYSLLSAIMVFFLAGMFFYVLGSEYNAIIQIAIYGLAIPVVLGLAVMFTNLKKDDKKISINPKIKYTMLLTGGLFLLSLIYLILMSLVMNPVGFNINYSSNTSLQVIEAFAKGIFVKYVFAFEIVSLILTIVVAGITIFNQKEVK